MTTLLILLQYPSRCRPWAGSISSIFSLGYGYGIVALSVAMLVMFGSELSASTVVLCALLFVFGFRLGTYLLVRERKAAAYRKILYDPFKKTPILIPGLPIYSVAKHKWLSA